MREGHGSIATKTCCQSQMRAGIEACHTPIDGFISAALEATRCTHTTIESIRFEMKDAQVAVLQMAQAELISAGRVAVVFDESQN